MAAGPRWVAFVCLLVVGAVPAFGQRVRGTLRDSTNGAAVGGAVLWLSDSSGRFLARSVADSAGRFAVPRLDGSAQLHVRRIGYRPADVRIAVSPGDTTVDLRLTALPLTLGPVEASRRQVCPGDKGTADALDLWEQARAGLLAAVVSREAGAPDVRLLSYTRRFGIADPRETHLAVTERDITADRSYVAARPAWAFAAEGYMREERGGDRTFYAPDEETLLDPSFADTHCLRVVAGAGEHAADIGIGFEPVKGRDTLVDVAGVLWLGRDVPQLHALEFHYTSLEPAARESGGDISFRVMPNGASMIDRWSIHSAIVVIDEPLHPSLVRRRLPQRSDRSNARLVGVQEFGGVVAYASWSNGQTWHASLPHVHGTVWHPSGQPASQVSVWLDGFPDTAATDSLGRFDIPAPLPGIYAVRASEPALARVGFDRTAMFAVTDTGQRYAVNLYLTPIGAVLRRSCRPEDVPRGSGVLLGRAIDAAGAAAHGVRIVATFTPAAGKDGKRIERATTADDAGRFAICGGPLDAAIHLSAKGDAGMAEADFAWTSDLLAAVVIVRPPGR